MDIVEVLWGSSLFIALHDRPALVHALLELVTETYIRALEAWCAIAPLRPDGNAHWGLYHRGSIMLRDDSAMNLSPAMFAEFVRSYDQRLPGHFGGGALHFCGRGDHYLPLVAEMRGVHAINLSQPECNDLARVLAAHRRARLTSSASTATPPRAVGAAQPARPRARHGRRRRLPGRRPPRARRRHPFATKFRAMFDWPLPGDRGAPTCPARRKAGTCATGRAPGLYLYPISMVLRGPGGLTAVKRLVRALFDRRCTTFSGFGTPYQLWPGQPTVAALGDDRYAISGEGVGARVHLREDLLRFCEYLAAEGLLADEQGRAAVDAYLERYRAAVARQVGRYATRLRRQQRAAAAGQPPPDTP